MTEKPPQTSRRPERGGRDRRVLVLACGDPTRGDDAAALLAADRLRAGPSGRTVAAVEIRPVGQLEPDDLADLGPAARVVVIDTVRGIPAGTIVRRSLSELPKGGPSPRSSHLLPLRDVLALVEVLRGSLPEGAFVGLGGETFELGAGLSAPVRAALPAYVQAIADEVLRQSKRQ
ncbi:MAG: hydrogenase maturation protease [Candidatus Limnocylindrales bacterium]